MNESMVTLLNVFAVVNEPSQKVLLVATRKSPILRYDRKYFWLAVVIEKKSPLGLFFWLGSVSAPGHARQHYGLDVDAAKPDC